MAKKAPEPTSPKETSQAQTSSNVGTAIANAFMQNPTENTPNGSTQVTQTGTYTWHDPYTGASYDIPTFTRNTTLSANQQAIKDQTDKAQLNLGTLANNQSAFLNDYMSKPFDGSNDATEARLMELGRKRLDPIIAQQDEALRTRLANQGVKAGSAAYDREMNNQNQSNNDAYNQLLLQGHGQAFNEAVAERNQPINEISALLSGSQVSMPQFMGANIGSIPTTDNAGIISNYDNQRIQAAQQDNAFTNSVLGGLFGLGGKLIGLSDKRAKKDIKKVGEVPVEGDNINLYSFRYKKGMGDGKQHVGVMAQEVEKSRPDAVTRRSDGMRQVDYGRLFKLGQRVAA